MPSDERASLPPVFEVAAIGASAGGVEALRVVLGALPARFSAAVLVVQHLDPHHKSLLPELLGRRCPLPVQSATGGAPIEAGTVWIAPPDMHLVLRGDRLELTDSAAVRFSRPSIDLLFKSVAEACGNRAIGVILTGTGVDGADGLRAIKDKGGTTIVQDPRDAAHTGMPRAAQATGKVDLTLPLQQIGPALARLVCDDRSAP